MARILIFLKPKYSETNQIKHLTKAPHEISKPDIICVEIFYLFLGDKNKETKFKNVFWLLMV